MHCSKQHSHLIFTVNLYGPTITPIMRMRNQGLEKLNRLNRPWKAAVCKRVKGKKEKEDLVSICTFSCYVKNDVSVIDSLTCVDGVIHMNSPALACSGIAELYCSADTPMKWNARKFQALAAEEIDFMHFSCQY